MWIMTYYGSIFNLHPIPFASTNVNINNCLSIILYISSFLTNNFNEFIKYLNYHITKSTNHV